MLLYSIHQRRHSSGIRTYSSFGSKKEREEKKKKAHQHKQVLLICASLIWIVRPEKNNNWIENTRCNVYSWDELFRKLLSIKVKRNRTTNEGYISS